MGVFVECTHVGGCRRLPRCFFCVVCAPGSVRVPWHRAQVPCAVCARRVWHTNRTVTRTLVSVPCRRATRRRWVRGTLPDAVGSVFSSVASSYDMMNDAMSLGIHRLWKNHFVEMLNPRGGIQCLDVAGGTGDIALRLLDHARTQHLDRETRVTVLDINPQMLIEGQKRLKETMYWNTPQIKFQLGNAEALDKPMEVPERTNPPASTRKNPILPPLVSEPIASESMDLYTIAFGIRNCTHIDQVIREAYRVLKPGGIFACLEFGKVSVPFLAQYVAASTDPGCTSSTLSRSSRRLASCSSATASRTSTWSSRSSASRRRSSSPTWSLRPASSRPAPSRRSRWACRVSAGRTARTRTCRSVSRRSGPVPSRLRSLR